MSDSAPPLAPELEQLLEEIAADPKRRLFAPTSRRLLRGLARVGNPVRASATGLRPAERHLLETKRAETAQVLREAYWSWFLRAAPTSTRVIVGGVKTCAVESETAHASEFSTISDQPETHRVLTLATRLLQQPGAELDESTPVEVLRLSLRLEESWFARLELARWAYLTGSREHALDAWSAAARVATTGMQDSGCALLRLAHGTRADASLRELLGNYLRHMIRLPEHPAALVNAMCFALLLGEVNLVRSLELEFEHLVTAAPADQVRRMAAAVTSGPVVSAIVRARASPLSASKGSEIEAQGALSGAFLDALR